MGMTIDEAKTQLIMHKSYALGNDYEAIEVALDTMRKYQQLQADYETRLKADMVAMLTDIQSEIEEMSELQTEIHGGKWSEVNVVHSRDALNLIQEKINVLKEQTDDK